MISVSERELKKLSRALRQIHSLEDPVFAPVEFANACASAIPCANSSFNVLELNATSIAVARSKGIKVPLIEESPLLRNLHQHTPIQSILRENNRKVLLMSDFYSVSDFHQTDLFNEYYRRSDTQKQMCFQISRNRDRSVIMAINHVSGSDFRPQDRLVAEVLKEQLELAWRSIHRKQVWKSMSATLEVLMGDLRQACVLLNHDGQAIFMPERGQRLLSRYFNNSLTLHAGLPEDLYRWAASTLKQFAEPTGPLTAQLEIERKTAEGVLNICLRPGGETVLPMLLLDERTLTLDLAPFIALGLTQRESEVLHWICEGKTNPEIATLLQSSVRTIHKHTQNIFAKLGVENRQMAMRLGIETLQKAV